MERIAQKMIMTFNILANLKGAGYNFDLLGKVKQESYIDDLAILDAREILEGSLRDRMVFYTRWLTNKLTSAEQRTLSPHP